MKNKMMRAAAIMMALVLVTSCFVGGTFAKYVTSGQGSDSARVAKWGVEVTVGTDTDKDIFKTEYATHNNDYKETITTSVKSSDTDKLVAPGTSGHIDFSISGKPETAVKIDIIFDDDTIKDVVIPVGTEVAGYTLTTEYRPVVFKLQKATDTSGVISWINLEQGSLAKVIAKAEALSASYGPNSDLEGNYRIEWEWAFEVEDSENTIMGTVDNGEPEKVSVDKLDTYLGNCADAAVTPATGVSTSIEFSFDITVTQID